MLHSISWTSFASTLALLSLLYYCIIVSIFFRKEAAAWLRRRIKLSILFLPVSAYFSLHAQTADGNNGINQANTMVRSYFDTGTQLLYAVGALAALIGAFKVFSLWQHGQREDMNRAAATWFGSCIFLVIVATVIKSFFGL